MNANAFVEPVCCYLIFMILLYMSLKQALEGDLVSGRWIGNRRVNNSNTKISKQVVSSLFPMAHLLK